MLNCFLVDQERNEELVQSCKIRFCFMLLQYLFSVILDGQDVLLNNFDLVLNSFKISSMQLLPRESIHVYIYTLNISFYIKATNEFNLSANECTYSSNSP